MFTLANTLCLLPVFLSSLFTATDTPVSNTIPSVTVFTSTPVCSTLSDGEIPFYNGSFDQALEYAQKEGKLLFVDFYADWCVPCQIMDETTFKDEFLEDYIIKNTVPIRVDVENEAEYDRLKKRFDVRTLPTMLVFNTSGSEKLRFEQTASASRLLYSMEKVNTPENRIKVLSVETVRPNTTTKPEIDTDHDKKVEKDSKITAWGVQIGAFPEMKYAMNHLEGLREFSTDFWVDDAPKNGRKIYRSVLGNFRTEEDAIRLRDLLQEKMELSGVVRNLPIKQ